MEKVEGKVSLMRDVSSASCTGTNALTQHRRWYPEFEAMENVVNISMA